MGLPLFQAPVESDIVLKSATKPQADSTHARSPIRRAERRRQLNETRQHRLQLLAALQGGPPPESRPRAAENPPPANDASARPDRWNFESELDDLNDILRAEDRAARRDALRSASALPGPDTMIGEESYLRADRAIDRDWTAGMQPSSREPSSRRFRDLPYVPGRLRPPVIRRQGSFESAPPNRSPRTRNPDPGEYLNEYRQRRNVQDGITRSRPHRVRRYVRYMDGLGDRDRSLSPENENIWENLQSTMTPDPQPPSVGSSFSSTTVSTVASQGTISSANTSITNPAEEVDPPCEPAGENVDSDEDGDLTLEEIRAASSQRRLPRSARRSYADVAADALPSADEDGIEGLELSDMQRLVQRLAARQDIPDQWWAAVGLSRSMTMDEPN
ncbi:hypothetical protein JX266_003841 [Neoarthrinium moseri]|uniref:uncharacterized protein n=1 Tax=Neoarthrinium moseri TaxID=1658444 RepID=UPI001FDD6101|nr:uncharacterized protein JN550_001937 [Neoarthrinium moseri]KAI1850559.1 hypothetical protein JX266_003841 [Neoarthrinium moseri]KAI1875651.1 hypothetical protein JN550_001937 [Neoarthrinium moseri]